MSEPFTDTAKPYGFCLPARVVAIVAHPDDETLWLGGQLRHIAELTLIHVTDGAPRDLTDAKRAGYTSREQYAEARARELEQALSAAGVDSARRVGLGCVDQEAVLNLPDLVRRTLPELTGRDALITHPYEGGHPDHDACAFIAQSACALLVRAGRRAPERFEFPSYHARGPQSLAGVFWAMEGSPEHLIQLGEEDVRRKRAAIDAFITQRPVLPDLSLELERVRPAPQYNFAEPPPPRAVLYDRFQWPLNSATWRAHASAAATKIGAQAPD